MFRQARSRRVREAGRPLLAAAALVVGALVAIVALQGPPSFDPDADDGQVFAMSADEALAASAQAPTWVVGDAWRVQFADGDPICWLVVVEASEEGYQQGVWCPTDEGPMISAQIAGFDVRYAGRFTRDLAAVGFADDGGDEQTRFFDWPLEDGKRWGTVWYGDEVEIAATFDPDMGRFVLTMCAESGDCIASYDYDPELGWWSEVDFNGGGRFRVRERADGWSGAVEVASASELLHMTRSGVGALSGASVSPFAVGDEHDAVAFVAERLGTSAGRLEVRDGSGNSVYQGPLLGDAGMGSYMLGGAPGTWLLVDATTSIATMEYWFRGVTMDTVTL